MKHRVACIVALGLAACAAEAGPGPGSESLEVERETVVETWRRGTDLWPRGVPTANVTVAPSEREGHFLAFGVVPSEGALLWVYELENADYAAFMSANALEWEEEQRRTPDFSSESGGMIIGPPVGGGPPGTIPDEVEAAVIQLAVDKLALTDEFFAGF